MIFEDISSLYFSEKHRLAIERVADSEHDNFQHLAELANLDPRKDFIGADLAEVDFSDCDLRNFNFSHANLSGSYGTDLRIDGTTVLDGANIENSVFKYIMIPGIFDNRAEEIEYRRLETKTWAEKCAWIDENIRENAEAIHRKIAIRLFFNENDLTVKTDILLRAKRLFRTEDDYRAFLVNTITAKGTDVKTFKSVIRVSAEVLGKDYFLYRTLLTYLPKADLGLSNIIASSLIRSEFFFKHYRKIKDALDFSSDVNTRILFLRHLNGLVNNRNDNWLRIDKDVYIDYRKPLDLKSFCRMIRYQSGSTIKEKLQKNRHGSKRRSEEEIIVEVESLYEKRISAFLLSFRKCGISLLSKDVEQAVIPESENA